MSLEESKETFAAGDLRGRFAAYMAGFTETVKVRIADVMLGKRMIVGDDPAVPADEFVL